MKAKDLRERSNDDLKELEKSLAKDTFTVRFKNFTNRLDDTSAIGKTKRDLARVKTLLRQAEMSHEATNPKPKAALKQTPKSDPKNAKKKQTTARAKKTSAAKSEAK